LFPKKSYLALSLETLRVLAIRIILLTPEHIGGVITNSSDAIGGVANNFLHYLDHLDITLPTISEELLLTPLI
jgi:hypothetical protein